MNFDTTPLTNTNLTLVTIKETRNIHRIIVHKNDPNTIYVGAIGYAWGDSEHRGVYRSKDGGKTSKKILYIINQTGAADFDYEENGDLTVSNISEDTKLIYSISKGEKISRDTLTIIQ